MLPQGPKPRPSYNHHRSLAHNSRHHDRTHHPQTLGATMAESQRILAAIVFTDVVGYSIRIQHEEEKTIALVKRDLAVFSSLCTQNSGKVIKNTGDGLLMFFT